MNHLFALVAQVTLEQQLAANKPVAASVPPPPIKPIADDYSPLPCAHCGTDPKVEITHNKVVITCPACGSTMVSQRMDKMFIKWNKRV